MKQDFASAFVIKYWQTDTETLASCPKDAFKILLYIKMETLKL